MSEMMRNASSALFAVAVMILVTVAIGVALYTTAMKWAPTITWFGRNTSIEALHIYASYGAKVGDEYYLLFWIGNSGSEPMTIDNVYINSMSYKDKGFKVFIIKEKNLRISDLGQKYVRITTTFDKDTYTNMTGLSSYQDKSCGHDYLLTGMGLCGLWQNFIMTPPWSSSIDLCGSGTHIVDGDDLTNGNYSVAVRFRLNNYKYMIYDLQDPRDIANISPTPLIIAIRGYYYYSNLTAYTIKYLDDIGVYYDVNHSRIVLYRLLYFSYRNYVVPSSWYVWRENMVNVSYAGNLVDGKWHNATLKVQVSVYPDEWLVTFIIDGNKVLDNVRLFGTLNYFNGTSWTRIEVPEFSVYTWVGGGLMTRPLYWWFDSNVPSTAYNIDPFKFKYNSTLDLSNVSIAYVNQTMSETYKVSFLSFSNGIFAYHYSDTYVHNGNTQYREGTVEWNLGTIPFYDIEQTDTIDVVGSGFNTDGAVLGISGYGLPYVLMPGEEVVLVLDAPEGKVVPGQMLSVNIHTASGGNYVAAVAIP